MEKEIKKTIEEIFKKTGCEISGLNFITDDDTLWCMIETPDSRFMIGREGETLRSLNHLVRKMIEEKIEDESIKRFFIDVNGYQKKRFENLKNIAHMMAERARYFKSDIEIDPMPAYERRIIHMFLEGYKDIKTESKGVSSDRHIVIKYINE